MSCGRCKPSGPYHLVGWSSGGQLAYEMACQLARQGQRVGSVAALDALRPDLRRPWRRHGTVRDGQWTAEERNAQWRYFMTTLFPQFDTLDIADPRHEFWPAFDAMGERARQDAVAELACRAGTADPSLAADEISYVLDVVLALDGAVAGYQPSAYPGAVDLYVTDVGSRRLNTVAYWESLPVRAVTSHHVPGDHTAVVELPGVVQVAATILAHVRSAVASSMA
jgi:thioesterase domain-containing protein